MILYYISTNYQYLLNQDFILSADRRFPYIMSSSSFFLFFLDFFGSNVVFSLFFCSLFSFVENLKQNLTMMHATTMTMIKNIIYRKQRQRPKRQWTRENWKLTQLSLPGTLSLYYWIFSHFYKNTCHPRFFHQHHIFLSSWSDTWTNFCSKERTACTSRSNGFKSSRIMWIRLPHSLFYTCYCKYPN